MPFYLQHETPEAEKLAFWKFFRNADADAMSDPTIEAYDPSDPSVPKEGGAAAAMPSPYMRTQDGVYIDTKVAAGNDAHENKHGTDSAHGSMSGKPPHTDSHGMGEGGSDDKGKEHDGVILSTYLPIRTLAKCSCNLLWKAFCRCFSGE